MPNALYDLVRFARLRLPAAEVADRARQHLHARDVLALAAGWGGLVTRLHDSERRFAWVAESAFGRWWLLPLSRRLLLHGLEAERHP